MTASTAATSEWSNDPSLSVTCERTSQIRQISKLHLLPFCLFIFAPLADFRPFAFSAKLNGAPSSAAMSLLAAESDPTMLILRGIAYIIALALFVKRLPEGLHFMTRQLTFLALSSYVLASMLWSSYPTKVFINFGHLLGMGLTLLALVWYFESKPDRVCYFFAWVVGVFILLSIPAALFLPAGVSLDGRWCGVTGNSNTLGMICVVSLWANAASLHCIRERSLRRWNWLLMGVTIIALVGSRSATSIITSTFVISAVIFLRSVDRDQSTLRIVKIFFLFWLALLALVTAYTFVPNVLGAEGFFGLFGRKANFSGRTKLWAAAWPLIHMKPWLGWSFDSNMSVLKSLGKVGQFHNGYLDLMVRGGWIGLTLFIGLILGIVRRLLALRGTNCRNFAIYTVFVAAVLVHNITEASIVRETHLLWTLLLFIYFFLYRLRLVSPMSV